MQTIDVKLSYLKALSPAKKIGVEEVCKREIDRLPEGKLSSASKQLLTLELAYCLEKHQRWCHNKLLHHLLVHFIVRRYKIESPLCQELLDGILRKIPRVVTPSLFDDEHQFLLFIIVSALTARGEALLADEIGLGPEILNLIKDAVTQSSDSRLSLVEFVPTLSTESWAILQDLADEYREKPWVFYLYKLMFLLADLPSPLVNPDRDVFTSFVFDLLGKIGEKKILSQARCEKIALASNLLSKARCRQLTETVMESLCKCELIYRVHGPSHHRNLTSYSLTREGYELTAEAFAYRNRRQIPKRSYFLNLERSWQEAFVRICDPQVFPYLFALLKEDPAPPPYCIEIIADRLAGYVEEGELLTALQEIGQKAISTRVKKASEKASAKLLLGQGKQWNS